MSSVVAGPGSSRRRSDRSSARRSAKRLAIAILKDWKRGLPCDARAALDAHPQVGRFPNLALELAYAEYCQRVDRGEQVQAEAFCQRFPECEASLWRQLAVEELLGPGPVDEAGVVWPEVGSALAGYVLLDELGRGTFSRVYLAAEEVLGHRLVAVKVCLHGSDEAETLGKLRHPHIVEVYSARSLDDGPLTLICMPYAGRATLELLRAARRRGERPTARQLCRELARREHPLIARQSAPTAGWLRGSYTDCVLRIGAAVARAVARAHEHGVAHLDLKPSNVLLSADGVPRLLDFNLSRDRLRMSTRLGGTLPYMSPEQLTAMYGDEAAADSLTGASDVYSLALLIHELLAGQLPGGEPARGPWDQRDLGSSDLGSSDLGGERPTNLASGLAGDGDSPGAGGEPTEGGEQRSSAAGGKLSPELLQTVAREWASREQAAALLARRQAMPRELSASALGVSRGCAALLARCLSPEPVDRPTMVEVAERLERETRLAARLGRSVRRHRGVALAACLAGFLGLAVAGWVVAQRPPYAERQQARASALYAAGDYSAAVECLDRALAHAPDSPDALLLRGRAYTQLQDYPSAIRDLQQAVEIRPDTSTYHWLGYSCAKAHYHLDAIAWYDRAHSLRHASADLFVNQAYSFYLLNRIEDARHSLNRALLVDDRDATVYHLLALVELKAARKRNAEPLIAMGYIERAIELAPPSAQLYYDSAKIYAFASQFDVSQTSRAKQFMRLAAASGVRIDILTELPPFQALLDDDLMSEFQAHSSGQVELRDLLVPPR
ncbi:MAG: tetratricopeptide repeat protein [Pirellulaceae bacterium]|nr:tetratricopeptide repeat protein [Pirellulaceae bacterium]